MFSLVERHAILTRMRTLLLGVVATLLLALPAHAAPCWFCRNETTTAAYKDGRTFCAKCLDENVFTEEDATPLRWEVETFLTEHFGNNRYAVTFTMYDQEEFENFRKRARLGVSIDGIYMHRERTVYMRSGMGPVNFQSLLAHESTHAWQHQFCPNQDRGLTEGFASLMQYHFALRKGNKWLAKQFLEDRDKDYGAALKQLLATEKEIGLFPLIDKVRASKTLAQVVVKPR